MKFSLKKKDQPATPEKQVQPSIVNEGLLNIITPSGVDVTNISANMSDNVGQIFHISGYAARPDYGWLARLCNIDGTTTTIEYRITNPEKITKVFDKSIKEYARKADNAKITSEKLVYEKAVRDLKEIIHRLSVEKQPIGYINIMLFKIIYTISYSGK